MRDREDGVLETDELDWTNKEETTQIDSSRYVISAEEETTNEDINQSTDEFESTGEYNLSVSRLSEEEFVLEEVPPEEVMEAISEWYLRNHTTDKNIRKQLRFLLDQL